MLNKEEWYSFWKWLFFGYGNKPGCIRLLTFWILLDIAIGASGAISISKPLSEIAVGVLVPLAGVFVGLSATVSSGTQALVSSQEINKLARFKDGGIADYVYPFQLSILFIFLSMSFWGAAASGLLDHSMKVACIEFNVFSAIGFSLTSSCIRLAWRCVSGGSDLVFAVFEVRNADGKQGHR